MAFGSRALGSRSKGSPADRTVTLVTRQGCHLCTEADDILKRMAAELGFTLDYLDVDSTRELRNTYGDRVPVVLVDGAEHGYWRVEEERLRKRLLR
jgi:glutaredoxin